MLNVRFDFKYEDKNKWDSIVKLGDLKETKIEKIKFNINMPYFMLKEEKYKLTINKLENELK